MHILQFFEKSSPKPKQTIWACQKCKNDIKYENPGENDPLGQKLGHFATMYPYSSPDHISDIDTLIGKVLILLYQYGIYAYMQQFTQKIQVN